MAAKSTLDKEIAHYRARLDVYQKETVLMVLKHIDEEEDDWLDEFVRLKQQELDEFELQKQKVIERLDKSIAEMKARKLTPNDKEMKTKKKKKS